jgi:hypothetical protein
LTSPDSCKNRNYRGMLLVAGDEPLGVASPALRDPQLSEQCERLRVQLRLDERPTVNAALSSASACAQCPERISTRA